MKYIRLSEERGVADHGWLHSKYSFSFENYNDPQNMGISALRVINEDVIAPAQGFAKHDHSDMEIISYVTQGSLKHEDSECNKQVVCAGEIQRLSAGSGVTHSEFNASDSEMVKFFQIWIHPNKVGIKPSYDQKLIPQDGPLTPLITPTGENGTLSITQEASLFRLMLKDKESFELTSGKYVGYFHIVRGELIVNGIDLKTGDAFSSEPDELLKFEATSDIEALWFELPTNY